MSDWIDVKERLPEPLTEVLFCWVNRDVQIVSVGFKDNADPDSNLWTDITQTDRDGHYEDVYTVTHWQPLPEPPESAPPGEAGEAV